VVVAFNVERYLCVCHAFWAHRVCTAANNRLAIISALSISLLCSLQWPIAYEVVECYASVDASRPHYLIQMKESWLLHVYYRLADYASMLGFNIAPILLLAVINFRLVMTLRRVVEEDLSRRSSADGAGGVAVYHGVGTHGRVSLFATSGESASQRLNANAMLFAVVALLFLCIGPQAPARLLYDYYGHYYHPTAVLYTCLSQLLVFLNASLNFCLYCLVSRRYRAMLRESVCRVVDRLRMVLRVEERGQEQHGKGEGGGYSRRASAAVLLLRGGGREEDEGGGGGVPLPPACTDQADELMQEDLVEVLPMINM